MIVIKMFMIEQQVEKIVEKFGKTGEKRIGEFVGKILQ